MTTYVSFHTGGAYAAEAQALRGTLDAFALPHVIEERPNLGDWCANCAQKPTFIREMRERLRGPIVWLDADARVVELPELFEDGLDWDVGFRRRHKPREVLSGTLYFADTAAARIVLNAWCAAQTATRWDQRCLADVTAHIPGRLPPAYCAIFDEGIEDPVILHMQASRRYKDDELGRVARALGLPPDPGP